MHHLLDHFASVIAPMSTVALSLLRYSPWTFVLPPPASSPGAGVFLFQTSTPTEIGERAAVTFLPFRSERPSVTIPSHCCSVWTPWVIWSFFRLSLWTMMGLISGESG